MADNNSTSKIDDSVLAKIRKLRNMTTEKGCTEAEAATAAAAMYSLLARHNLSLAELKESDVAPEDRSLGEHRYQANRRGWRPYLWQAVSRLNFCEYLVVRGGHAVIGTKANCEATQEMAEWLVETVVRLSNDAARQQSKDQNSYRLSFRAGCSDRLRHRIDLLREQARKGAIKPADGDTKLPALANLYDLSSQRLADFMQQHHPKLKNSKISHSVKDMNGYTAGRDAAEGVTLKPAKKIAAKGKKHLAAAAG
jgi:hypothetical protein